MISRYISLANEKVAVALQGVLTNGNIHPWTIVFGYSQRTLWKLRHLEVDAFEDTEAVYLPSGITA